MPIRHVAAVLILLAACDRAASTTTIAESGPTTSTHRGEDAPVASPRTTAASDVRQASEYLDPSLLVVPLGRTAELGDYDVTLIEVEADVTEAVLSEDQSINPPPEGEQFVLLKLKVVYRGEASGIPGINLGLRAFVVAPDLFELRECTYPDGLMDIPELFPGGEAIANLCLSVPSNSIDLLVLEVNPQTGPRFRPEAERRQFFLTSGEEGL